MLYLGRNPQVQRGIWRFI